MVRRKDYIKMIKFFDRYGKKPKTLKSLRIRRISKRLNSNDK